MVQAGWTGPRVFETRSGVKSASWKWVPEDCRALEENCVDYAGYVT